LDPALRVEDPHLKIVRCSKASIGTLDFVARKTFFARFARLSRVLIDLLYPSTECRSKTADTLRRRQGNVLGSSRAFVWNEVSLPLRDDSITLRLSPCSLHEMDASGRSPKNMSDGDDVPRDGLYGQGIDTSEANCRVYLAATR